MTALPNNWTDEDRSEIVEQIVEGMVSEYTLEQLRQYVWDSIYDQLIFQEWSELWIQAEKYAPELVDRFKLQNNAQY
jgi:hypothetical protein